MFTRGWQARSTIRETSQDDRVSQTEVESAWNSAMGRPQTVYSANIDNLGGWAKWKDYQFQVLDMKTPDDMKELPHYKVLKYKDAFYMGQVMVNNGKKRDGQGLMQYVSGRLYEGFWKNDLWEGQGFEVYASGNTYKGAFANGRAHGHGIYEWWNGEVYDGEWNRGVKEGHGMWKNIKGDQYIGMWKNSKANGHGIHVWSNGDKYEGEWKNFMKHGWGSETFANGDTYCGQYFRGWPQGKG